MKRKTFLFFLIFVLALSACKLPAPNVGTPVSIDTATATTLPQPEVGAGTPEVPAGEPAPADKPLPSPTFTQPPAVTSTAAAPTATSIPPTAVPQVAQPTPTKTAQPTATYLDPNKTYGKPTYLNPMVGGSFTEWANPETKSLPDDDNIKLEFKDGKLYVTGKQPSFSTWWFTYHTLKDFYLEMTFDTEECSGSDAYGLIIRGPDHLAGVSYGYVVAFTCDGQYWVFRLDGIDPWEAEDLVNETESDYINTGSDEQNVIGVRAEGETLTVFANGYQVAQVKDKEFSQGRFGAYVRAVDTVDYTYRITKIAYWDLAK